MLPSFTASWKLQLPYYTLILLTLSSYGVDSEYWERRVYSAPAGSLWSHHSYRSGQSESQTAADPLCASPAYDTRIHIQLWPRVWKGMEAAVAALDNNDAGYFDQAGSLSGP